MTERTRLALGVVGGLIWSVVVLRLGAGLEIPVFTLVPTVMSAFLAPGVVMALMMLRQMPGVRRNESDAAGEIHRQVLGETQQQLVLALCIWPAAAVMLQGDGPGVIMALGVGLALARLVAWAGALWLPPLRTIGLVASYSPTVAVAGWALWRLIASFSAA